MRRTWSVSSTTMTRIVRATTADATRLVRLLGRARSWPRPATVRGWRAVAAAIDVLSPWSSRSIGGRGLNLEGRRYDRSAAGEPGRANSSVKVALVNKRTKLRTLRGMQD